ncbi:MAG: hypothetical protein BZ136_07370 [Methanosphaera sp. rholeuAM74]|nr:MAG: hypothetical protein BZ136_07370 [Methanosphaera sp. rholeuAM74]
MNNKNKIFFVLTVLALLLAVSTAYATNDANTTTATTDTPQITGDSPTQANSIASTNTITKNNKEKKTTTKTVEVNDMNELTNNINSAINDTDNNEYIINLNDGTYEITSNTIYNPGTNTPNIIINANGQTLSSSTTNQYIRFNNGCNVTINNATFTLVLQNYANNMTIIDSLISNTIRNNPNMNLTIENSTINATLNNNGNTFIGDDVIFTDSFTLSGTGNVTINDTSKILPYMSYFNGNYTLENLNITTDKQNDGNLTIKNANITTSLYNGGNLVLDNVMDNNRITNINRGNLTIRDSILNCSLTNNGKLVIEDNVVFGERFSISGSGPIEIDDISVLAPYLSTFNGTYTLENMVISREWTNYGNLTLVNITLNYSLYNRGNMEIINSTVNSSNLNHFISNTGGNLSIHNTYLNNIVTTNGNLTIDDDVTFGENFKINVNAGGVVISNDITRITPYMSRYNGTFIVENVTINQDKQNIGNLTIRNCTLNSTITNSGVLTICDDVVFGEKFTLAGNGKLIINDTDRIVLYMSTYNGTYTIENTTLTTTKTNYGNLTIKNSTINSTINNYGGVLTICDDVIFVDRCTITNSIYDNGTIVINNTNRIAPYLRYYNDTYTIENIDLSFRTTKENYGNLSIINSTISSPNSASISNYKNLTITDSTIKARIYAYDTVTVKNSTLNGVIELQTYNGFGILIIEEDVVFGENFQINGGGKVIINDASRVTPYMTTFNGTYTIQDTNRNKTITNAANLTIKNTTLSASVTNNGNMLIEDGSVLNNNIYLTNNKNLTINNSTLNGRITNYGNLTLGDEVVLGENFQLSGNGMIFSNNLSAVFPYITTFNGEGTATVTDYNNTLQNNGNLTLENSTLLKTITNNVNGQITFKNTTTYNTLQNSGTMIFENATIDTSIINNGVVIISDDTILTDNFTLTGTGEVIINDTNRIALFIQTYNGNYSINNKTITEAKENYANLTLTNCAINEPITNYGNLTLNNCNVYAEIINEGVLIIDEDTVISPNTEIKGNGEIITDDITRLLPYISCINGNYTITDVTLNKTYKFNGNVTLDNCNITKTDNINYGVLNINNCNIDVDDEETWIENIGLLIINDDSTITGEIENYGDVFYDNVPEDYTYNPTVHIVNNKTVNKFFSNGGLNGIVKYGDTLDVQGQINRTSSLIINKPVNMITTTNDGYITLNSLGGDYFGTNPGSSFIISTDGSNSNITGIYFYNTQLWLYNTHNVTLDNISAVVENRRIGSGVGQTSIRANSTNITVKNSYISTTENEGSSSLVLAWADNCTIENCTVVGNGFVGNLIYLTTYNVDIPDGTIVNCNNKILNNTLIGPEKAISTCYTFAFAGVNNTFDGNTVNYTGIGVSAQWGSGVNGTEQSESLFAVDNNTVSNNKFYGGCGITAGNYIYNNFVESGAIRASHAYIYNNTAYNLQVLGQKSEIYDNTITNQLSVTTDTRNYALVENNTIAKILIQYKAENVTFNNNNITSTVYLNGSNIIFTNNNITTDDEYTIIGNRLTTNNIITNNYLKAAILDGDASVNISKEENNVVDNIPVNTVITFDTDSVVINRPTTITVTVVDVKGNTMTDGSITFTDAEGNILGQAQITEEATTLEVTYNTIETQEIIATYTSTQELISNCTTTQEISIEKVPTQITINPVEVTSDATTITATVTDELENPINTGRVYFKVDGKVLRDPTTKRVLYIDVEDGSATTPELDTTSWSNQTSILAVYQKTATTLESTSEVVNPTISIPEADEPVFAVDDVTTQAGSEVTIMVNTKNLDSGKVVLKVNGKTVKSSDGKLYAKVIGDTTTFTYVLPKTLNVGEYSVKAVYTSGSTKLEADSKLIVE